MQIEQEGFINIEDKVFLDRAIPDALAYYQFLKLDYDENLIKAIEETFYKKFSF